MADASFAAPLRREAWGNQEIDRRCWSGYAVGESWGRQTRSPSVADEPFDKREPPRSSRRG